MQPDNAAQALFQSKFWTRHTFVDTFAQNKIFVEAEKNISPGSFGEIFQQQFRQAERKEEKSLNNVTCERLLFTFFHAFCCRALFSCYTFFPVCYCFGCFTYEILKKYARLGLIDYLRGLTREAGLSDFFVLLLLRTDVCSFMYTIHNMIDGIIIIISKIDMYSFFMIFIFHHFDMFKVPL